MSTKHQTWINLETTKDYLLWNTPEVNSLSLVLPYGSGPKLQVRQVLLSLENKPDNQSFDARLKIKDSMGCLVKSGMPSLCYTEQF